MRRHLPGLFAGSQPEGRGLVGPLANIVELARASPDVIDPLEARPILEGSATASLVDVRSIDEYAGGHARDAICVPLPDLAAGAATVLPDDKNTEIVAICKVGERSLSAMLLLKSLGYQKVKSVRGGLDAWVAAGLPTDPR